MTTKNKIAYYLDFFKGGWKQSRIVNELHNNGYPVDPDLEKRIWRHQKRWDDKITKKNNKLRKEADKLAKQGKKGQAWNKLMQMR